MLNKKDLFFFLPLKLVMPVTPLSLSLFLSSCFPLTLLSQSFKYLPWSQAVSTKSGHPASLPSPWLILKAVCRMGLWFLFQTSCRGIQNPTQQCLFSLYSPSVPAQPPTLYLKPSQKKNKAFVLNSLQTSHVFPTYAGLAFTNPGLRKTSSLGIYQTYL